MIEAQAFFDSDERTGIGFEQAGYAAIKNTKLIKEFSFGHGNPVA